MPGTIIWNPFVNDNVCFVNGLSGAVLVPLNPGEDIRAGFELSIAPVAVSGGGTGVTGTPLGLLLAITQATSSTVSASSLTYQLYAGL